MPEWIVTEHAMVRKSDILSIKTEIYQEFVHPSNKRNSLQHTYAIYAVTESGDRPLYIDQTYDELPERLRLIAGQMTNIE